MVDLSSMEISDDLMAQAKGGLAEADPYGYVCEATVISRKSNGVSDYSVDADNGLKYISIWRYPQILRNGDRVQLLHQHDGTYSLEPLPLD